MPISSIGSGVGLASMPEFPGILVRSDRQRVSADKITATLPGNNRQNIHRVTADIAHVSQTFNKKLHFIVDHQSNEVIVKVIDKTTDKVIKVLPPEELQRLHSRIRETIGFLFDTMI